MAGRTDYEGAWRELRDLVLGKPSHGKRELLEAMALIESSHTKPREASAVFLRDFLDDVEDAFTNAAGRPLTDAQERAQAMQASSTVDRPDRGTEDHHEHHAPAAHAR